MMEFQVSLSIAEIGSGENKVRVSHYLCFRIGILIEGSASVLKAPASGGPPKAVGRLGKDKSFGEMSVLNREPRSATVIADTEVKLLILPRAEFDRLLDTQPKMAAKFLLRLARLLSQRLRETTGQLAEQLG